MPGAGGRWARGRARGGGSRRGATVLALVLLATAVIVVDRLATPGPAGLTPADRGVVDVVSTLGLQAAAAAGTGIVISPAGDVLTNNHVVDGATSLSVTDVATGRTYSATVVGTDAAADVAVIHLAHAAGLATARLGDSATVHVGDHVVGVGNAGGVGGVPRQAAGTVTALGQTIEASSPEGAVEQLSGLIQTDADIVAGDSGGPLENASQAVVGIDTAASNGYSFGGQATNAAYAIPIDTAMAVARQIEAGRPSADVHIGPSAFLGVEVRNVFRTAGAFVAGVFTNSPADAAGITPGDLITSFGGRAVASAADLTNDLRAFHPGDTATIGWTDPAGAAHNARVHLVTGPAD